MLSIFGVSIVLYFKSSSFKYILPLVMEHLPILQGYDKVYNIYKKGKNLWIKSENIKRFQLKRNEYSSYLLKLVRIVSTNFKRFHNFVTHPFNQ